MMPVRPIAQAWIISLILLLAAGGLHALTTGTYTDYVWQSDYHAPGEPVAKKLSCEEFMPSSAFCASLEKMGDTEREQLILASLRKLSPEENHDLIRQYNSQNAIGTYYESTPFYPGGPPDGEWGENGSLRNMWFRLIQIYPSVYDERDGYYYVNDQPGIQTQMRMAFAVPNPTDGDWCAQKYDIKGYDVNLLKTVGTFTTMGRILPIANLLQEGQRANLTITMSAIGEYEYRLSKFGNNTTGTPETGPACELAVINHTIDTLTLSRTYPIKRYPTTLDYSHVVSIPQSGFAQGLIRIKIPSDFLSYQIKVKGYTYSLSRNDLKFMRRGELQPVLGLNLITAPARSGTMHMSEVNESDDGTFYTAELRYKLPIETPDIGSQDCSFELRTPFGTKSIPDPANPEDVLGGCQPTRSPGKVSLKIVEFKNNAGLVRATVEDPLGNSREGIEVAFTAGNEHWQKTTNAVGVAEVWIPQDQSMMAVEAKLSGSEDVAEAQTMLFMPGKGVFLPGEKTWLDMTWERAPILLILLLISSLMIWLVRRRSSAVLLLVLILAAAMGGLWAQNATIDQGGITDLQATIDACRNYDFDNAVRHFGECAESYRLSQEFSSMRRTAVVLIANIAPLVVATPDITPYRDAYANMMSIALALFRVAWAFNSLYLILNIFNPAKRNDALKQYIWLLVFVIFAYFSFGLIRESINAINNVSIWIAGTDAAATLTQASLSAEFVAENYEMLKLVLPFLNVTYLVLLARYVSVIGMMLFFPFSLLLFFTTATRGFGRAALTVTFAALGLGVINAILLLIYGILARTSDPALAGSFATTFFSASFIVFFGFVNLLVLSVAFLSGIVFIGTGRGGEA